MDLDNFKKEWQQGLSAPEQDGLKGSEGIVEKVERMNRKILLSNMAGSLALASTIVVMGLIWHAYPDRSAFFYGGLIGVMLIILAAIAAMWWRTIFWKNMDFSQNSQTFIEHSLRKLYRSRWVRKQFMPAYHSLLYVSIMCYTVDLTLEANWKWKVCLFAGNTLFIGFMAWITNRFSKKKASELDDLIQALEDADGFADKAGEKNIS